MFDFSAWWELSRLAQRILGNRYLLSVVAALALVAAGYWYWNHSVEKAATVMVEQHDAVASQQVQTVTTKIIEKVKPIDRKYDDLARNTLKDYDNVRLSFPTDTPSSAAEAPLDPVLLDTLNGLARLHQGTSSDRVSPAAD